MKARNLFFFLICITAIIACKEDYIEGDWIYEKSFFEFKEKQYDLSKGFIINYGKEEPFHGNTITLNLISSGIEIFDKSSKIDSARGFGHLLFFEVYAYHNKEIPTGKYTFDSDYNRRPYTFDSGRGFLNMVLPAQRSQTFQVASGELNVINAGQGRYEIDFNCKDYEGTLIKGSFKGNIKFYDYTSNF